MLSNELPLIDYITTIGNFQPSYITTGFYASGYYDMWNVDTLDISDEQDTTTKTTVQTNRLSLLNANQDNTVSYDFLFRPPAGILNSIKPLAPNFELKIALDRAPSDLCLLNSEPNHAEPLSGKPLELKNVFLKARYYSSPYMRSYFNTIEEKDISYFYDECVVYQKNLPQGETNIRLSNVIGGNTPKYLFAGIISSSAINGDNSLSSTKFTRHGIKEFDMTLNGYSCNGFPIVSENGSPIQAYEKFLTTTGCKYQTGVSGMLNPFDFQSFHYLFSHKFEGEATENGWLGFNLKLEKAFEDNYVLGKLFSLFPNN